MDIKTVLDTRNDACSILRHMDALLERMPIAIRVEAYVGRKEKFLAIKLVAKVTGLRLSKAKAQVDEVWDNPDATQQLHLMTEIDPENMLY